MEKYVHIADEGAMIVMGRYEQPVQEGSAYQSEAALEESFIEKLVSQGYERLHITSEAEMLANLRRQLELLNEVTLTDGEWQRLRVMLLGEQMSIEDKTEIIQRNNILSLPMDNGENRNICIIDRKNIHRNRPLQVLNQYEEEGGAHKTRYDVTILVNGLPLVHIELKRRGVSIQEAFNQINRYQRNSFWAGCGLYDYAQIFIISNGTETKYYSNTTRYAHVHEVCGVRSAASKRESNSFEFTSYWTDTENNRVAELLDFAERFLNRKMLLYTLTRYCVFTVDKNLMVMRPYQIAATEAILRRINQALNNRTWLGTTQAGGYIWHTTGSGKTLTSFKTAQLASMDERVRKVLFVVDRKDLDYQTMREYNNFEPECANSNSSSQVLLRQLKDRDCRIIITTIQKLANLMKPSVLGKDEELQEVLKQEVVIIFDECHRSQFGDMQKQIRRRVKRYMMFGFTGTPIFVENASLNYDPKQRTTAQVFGGEPDDKGQPTRALHTYTIINAINDQNVLKFKVDYVTTMKIKEDAASKEVWGINTEEAWRKPERIKLVAKYILEHFDEKTKQADIYGMSHLRNVAEMVKRGKRAKAVRTQKLQTRGFNSILAVDSIKTAIAYYNELQEQMRELDESQRRTVAMIYTFVANEAEDDTGTLEDENPEGVGQLDGDSREALQKAIDQYNETFGTNYTTDGDKFQSYYKDLSLRMKDKQIDILIVVGMFLTGFDAKTLNTLWVDKNLKWHGLLQAYSRTNRILNAVKNCGNIVCFRNLEEATNKCLGLFGDKDASGIVLMRPFEDYYYGYEETQKNGQEKHIDGYVEMVERLLERFPLTQLKDLCSEKERKEFIRLMGAVLKMQNLLTSFDEFTMDRVRVSDELDFNELKMQDYLSWYDTHYRLYRQEHESAGGKKESIDDDVVYELELVKQVSIGIDYILALVAKYHETNCADASIMVRIQKALDASPELKDKKELVEHFIEAQTPNGEDIMDSWETYVAEQRRRELEQIISEENLNGEEAARFMQQAFEEGFVTTSGLAVTRMLPPMPIFGAGAQKRAEKKKNVIEKLEAFFRKYFNLIESNKIYIDI